MIKDYDMIGKRFDMLVVIEEVENSKDGKKQYLCKCDCGKERVFRGTELRSGRVHSCGCIHWNKKYKNFRFENESDKRMYRIWNDLKRRCTDTKRKDYKRYGGIGISVCDEWADFQCFLDWAKQNGYADNLTIDRIDRFGNYEPSNCRWVDAYTQANNRSNNHWITFRGETLTMMQWSNKIGLSYSALRDRLKRGWSIERALTTPLLRTGGGK